MIDDGLSVDEEDMDAVDEFEMDLANFFGVTDAKVAVVDDGNCIIFVWTYLVNSIP